MNRARLMPAAAAAAALLLAALALKAAVHTGLISPPGAGRSFQVMLGVGLALYANRIPKDLGAMRGLAAASRKQAALRVAGWSFCLAGIAYAVLTAVLPTPTGDALGAGAVAAALVLTLVVITACRYGPRAFTR